MRQSVYTQISKAIGFRNNPVAIPSLEQAKELKIKIEQDQCKTSFITVFTIYRYCGSPINDDQQEALETICEAFRIGTHIFQNIFDDEQD